MVTTGMVLKARDTVKHFTMHRLAHTTKNYSAPNVNNAKI